MNWPLDGLRRVSVNCFGFGGTNAHVILDEAPEYLYSRCLIGNHSSADESPSSPLISPLDTEAVANCPASEYQLFLYSAHEKSGVSRTMTSHSEYIKSKVKTCPPRFLRDYSYTLACRRSNLEWKGFVVAKSINELATKLETAGSSDIVRSLRSDAAQIAFVFSGQGTQWPKMGQDLMEFEVFKNSIEEASEYLLQCLQSPFNLLQEILRDEFDSAISFPHIAQPATTAVQVALVDLLHSYDITPSSVVGHSSGEIAAAYAGGAISRFEAWEIAYFRGLAAISLPFRAPKLKGAMMVIGMSMEWTRKYLEESGKSAEIACANSPESTTISGRIEVITDIDQDLTNRTPRVFHRILKVRTAYHSSYMRLVEEDYRDSLVSIKPREFHEGVRMFSSLTGKPIQGDRLVPRYWSDNMVNPVQFVAAITSMMEQPAQTRPTILVEIGPNAALRSPTTETMASILVKDSIPMYYSVLQPKFNGVSKLLGLIGDLWIQGCPLNMEQVVVRGRISNVKCLTDLPPYAWNHSKSYWHESHLSITHRNRAYPRQDFIGAPTTDSTPFEPRWRGFLRISENPWIQDHQVQKTIVYPAAGMVSMVLEGAKQIKPESDGFLGYEISDMTISKAMIVPNNEHGLETVLNIKIATDLHGEIRSTAHHEFSIYSKHLTREWEKNATGFIHFKYATGSPLTLATACQIQMDKVSDDCKEAMNSRQLYEALDTMGMNYGPTFQNMSDIYKGNGACRCKVTVPDTKAKMPSKFEYQHILHPATLDSMFHSLFVIDAVPMVPTYIKSLFVSTGIDQDGPKSFSGFATADRVGLQDASAKIVMNGSGHPGAHVVIDGIYLTALQSTGSVEDIFLPNFRNLCTEIIWKRDVSFNLPTSLAMQIDLLAHKYPGLAVLQVGGNSRSATKLLQLLAATEEDTPRLSKFTLLGPRDSRAYSRIMKKFKRRPAAAFIERKTDIRDISAFYHLIVFFEDSGVEIGSLKNLLGAGGILMQLEPNSVITETDAKAQHPINAVVHKNTAVFTDLSALMLILLIPDESNDEIAAFTEMVTSWSAGLGLVVRAATSREILNLEALVENSVVLSLLDVCYPSEQPCSILQWDESHFNLFKDLQKSAKGMICLTRGAHMNPQTLQGSSIIGLARTLMSEDPRKMIVTFDVDVASQLAETTLVKNIIAVFSQTFCKESSSTSSGCLETEFAEKDGEIFIPRLKTIKPLNQIIEGNSPSAVKRRAFHGPEETDAIDLKLSLVKVGLSEDSCQFTEFPRTDIRPDEVDIKFRQALLTSRDVETALGRNTESTIGLDVRGTITRVGRDVTEFRPGDEVVALVSGGSIRTTARAKVQFVQRHETAAFPSLLVSAYYAIVYMGRAMAGKSVLIHAGASPHGLVAMQIAKLSGVHVFATVVGQNSDGQRKILTDCGLPSERIFNAADDYVPCLLSMTGGKGVDMVYDTMEDSADCYDKCVKNCKLMSPGIFLYWS